MINDTSPIYTGTQINYYFVCQRKLWLFSHHIQMEQESDMVKLGKVIHEQSYSREHKEIEIEHIKLDWLNIKDGILHEVKKDDALEEAHEWQVLYYLYYLKCKGISLKTAEGSSPNTSNTLWQGEIDYPKLKKRIEVILTHEKEMELLRILENITRIIALSKPPAPSVPFSLCKKCSYCELCHS